MKKYVLVGLSMVLAVALAITGTIAYLTDRDSAANVFTMGNVDITLTEDFEQGSALIPGVDINKDVAIQNTGKNDAWVWYTYAVPTALVDTGNNASKNAVHFNLEGAYWDAYYTQEAHYTAAGLTEPVSFEETWNWTGIEHNQTIDESGIAYTVVTVAYNGKLAPGKTTGTSLTNVYLDTRVDIDPEGNMAWVENGVATDLNWNVNTDGAPMVYVAAYAIQAEEFASVQDAMAAYAQQWGENGAPEFAVPVTVSSADELVASLNDGKDVVLTDDVEVTSPITLNGSSLNGGGKTLDSDYVGTSGWGQYAIVANSGTVENINVVDAFRGIGSTNTTDDIYIKNVTIDNVTYAINGNGTGTQNVYVSDSTVYGWISYADVASINFTDCTLGQGNSYIGYMVIYGTTNYTNCKFEDGFAMCGDLRGNLGATVTFTNCTYSGAKVTANNFKTLFMAEGDDTDFNKLSNYKIVIDGVTVVW